MFFNEVVNSETQTEIKLSNLALGQGIQGHQRIQRGTDSYCTTEQLTLLVQAIKANPTLVSFSFDALMNADEVSMQMLADALKDSPSLQHIEITISKYQNNINDAFLRTLFSCLLGNANIKTLYVNSPFDFHTALPLLTTALAGNRTLESITLKHIAAPSIAPIILDENLWANFAEALTAQGKIIRNLSIFDFRMEHNGLFSLANGLSTHGELRSLNLVNCSLKSADMNDLVRLLDASVNIERLNLNSNAIEEGMATLAPTLAKLTNLNKLQLNSTRMTSDTVSQVILGINYCPLTELALDFNSFSSDNVMSLCHFISTHPMLTKLSLNYCSLQDEHVQQLAMAISASTHFKAVKLFSQTQFSTKTQQQFIKTLDDNPNLVNLEIFQPNAELKQATIAARKKPLTSFKNAVIGLANAYFSNPADNSFLQMLPLEIVAMIMNEFTNHLPSTIHKHEAHKYINLVSHSFYKRRELITKNHYPLPTENLPTQGTISAWWTPPGGHFFKLEKQQPDTKKRPSGLKGKIIEGVRDVLASLPNPFSKK